MMKILFLLCCLLSTTACRKKQEPSPGESILRIKAGIGIVAGLSSFKTIGTEGDRHGLFNIQLDIPAGALRQTTGIGISIISNTLPGSPGKAFRILPTSIAFQKPIDIVYTYSEAEKQGGALYLAYQDDEAYWTIMKQTKIDTVAHTLTITTTRTGDWTIYSKL